MKLLTRDTDYAVRALGLMAAQPIRVWTVHELSRASGIPWPFLRRILQRLHRGGFLGSFKGSRGGFRLQREAKRISLLDLVETFQGPFCLNECSFKRRRCPRTAACLLRKKLARLERTVRKQMRGLSLQSLMGSGE